MVSMGSSSKSEDYIPSDDPLLKLTFKRCEIVEKHQWVKNLYDQAVDWKQSLDKRIDEIDDLSDDIRQKRGEIALLEAEVQELKDKLEKQPGKEETLSATHVMVEHSFWKEQKAKLEELTQSNKLGKRASKLLNGLVTLDIIYAALHCLKFLP